MPQPPQPSRAHRRSVLLHAAFCTIAAGAAALWPAPAFANGMADISIQAEGRERTARVRGYVERAIAFLESQGLDLSWRKEGEPLRILYPSDEWAYYAPSQHAIHVGDAFEPEELQFVFWHELGHALLGAQCVSFPPGSGGTHYADRCYTTGLAISEGFATALAAFIAHGLDAARVPVYGVPDLEDISRYELCEGETNEMRVAAVFWDLADRHEDGVDSVAIPFRDLFRVFSPTLDANTCVHLEGLLDYMGELRKALPPEMRAAVDRVLLQDLGSGTGGGVAGGGGGGASQGEVDALVREQLATARDAYLRYLLRSDETDYYEALACYHAAYRLDPAEFARRPNVPPRFAWTSDPLAPRPRRGARAGAAETSAVPGEGAVHVHDYRLYVCEDAIVRATEEGAADGRVARDAVAPAAVACVGTKVIVRAREFVAFGQLQPDGRRVWIAWMGGCGCTGEATLAVHDQGRVLVGPLVLGDGTTVGAATLIDEDLGEGEEE